MTGKKRRSGAPLEDQEHEVSEDRLGEGDEAAPPPDDGSTVETGTRSGSRTAQRQGERSRKRRKATLTVLAVILIALLAGLAAWRWSDVGGAARWVGDKVSGLWEEDRGGEGEGEGLFLVNPLTGQRFQDSSINALVCLTADGEIRSILYVSRAGDGRVKYFFIPEGIVGKAQDGTDLSLSRALAANPERTVELRYMVESLTGQPVHYVVVLPLKSLLLLADEMGFPAVKVTRDTEVHNPYTGAREKLTAGQELKDTDRIIAYLLAEGDPEEYAVRCERGEAYLPGLMEGLRGWSQEDLAAALRSGTDAFQINPAPSGEGEAADYLASLVAAWAGGGTSDPSYFEAPRIEILNGCGVVGAGTNMKSALESRGFEVAEAGRNAKVVEGGQEYNDFSHQASIIRYGSRDPLAEAYAKYLAMLFKIPKVEHSEDAGGMTIIVGSDLATPSNGY